MRDDQNRLFVYAHTDKGQQDKFLSACTENGCFAQVIPFEILQTAWEEWGNKEYDKTRYSNGQRPHLTLSNANPDKISNYRNWAYLESIIETGWRHQFTFIPDQPSPYKILELFKS